MRIDQSSQFSDLELEFMQEEKGNGSLSPHIVGVPANASNDMAVKKSYYVGFDIRPEDIEALYFEGIGVPRWESIKAESVEQREALYMEQFQKQTSDYPLISRVSDTDQNVAYTSAEVLQLLEECDRVMAGASDPKAIRALQKLSLAGNRAAINHMGLELIPV